MADKKIGFLTDGEGNPSMTRLLSALTCAFGWAIPVVSAVMGTMNAHTVAISIGFVGIGITGKVVGAKIENS